MVFGFAGNALAADAPGFCQPGESPTLNVTTDQLPSDSLSYPFSIGWFQEPYIELGEEGCAGFTLRLPAHVCATNKLADMIKEIRKNAEFRDLNLETQTANACLLLVHYPS